VVFRLPENLDEKGVDAFLEAFLWEAIEAPGLMCGGGCGRVWNVFVVRNGRVSATEEDGRKVGEWLERRPVVSDIRIGLLVDAWHSA